MDRQNGLINDPDSKHINNGSHYLWQITARNYELKNYFSTKSSSDLLLEIFSDSISLLASNEASVKEMIEKRFESTRRGRSNGISRFNTPIKGYRK